MSQVEDIFDINNILQNTYSSLRQLQSQQNTELIFEMDRSIPRELRGNTTVLTELLTTVLSFILHHGTQEEVLLSISAPEDFLYEENISFKIKDTQIPKQKLLAFLETGLGNNLSILNGMTVNDENLDLYLQIPFMIAELGFRRHYRLPSPKMLNKKVLLIIESQKLAKSMTTMLKYFPYYVEIDTSRYKDNNIDLSIFDLVIIDENLLEESFCNYISKAQGNSSLKYVILGKTNRFLQNSRAIIHTHMMKPVTQEVVFDLIVSIFDETTNKNTPKRATRQNVVEEKILTEVRQHIPTSINNTPEDSSISRMIEEKKSENVLVLNKKSGLENCKRQGLKYSDELELFLETFYKSDLYFRQIVKEKQTNKIKDFCIDLEKQSKIIGAESMQKFSDIVSLIFVYNKLDMLPIYPGRYHIELTKLVDEIKKYLYI